MMSTDCKKVSKKVACLLLVTIQLILLTACGETQSNYNPGKRIGQNYSNASAGFKIDKVSSGTLISRPEDYPIVSLNVTTNTNEFKEVSGSKDVNFEYGYMFEDGLGYLYVASMENKNMLSSEDFAKQYGDLRKKNRGNYGTIAGDKYENKNVNVGGVDFARLGITDKSVWDYFLVTNTDDEIVVIVFQSSAHFGEYIKEAMDLISAYTE